MSSVKWGPFCLYLNVLMKHITWQPGPTILQYGKISATHVKIKMKFIYHLQMIRSDLT